MDITVSRLVISNEAPKVRTLSAKASKYCSYSLVLLAVA